MQNLLLFHVYSRQPDLASRCRQLSFEQTVSECLTWSQDNKSKNHVKNDARIKCDYCNHLGHPIAECRKKKKADKIKALQGKINNDSVLSVNKVPDSIPFQLDTAADYHVSGKKNDLSSYTKSPQTIL